MNKTCISVLILITSLGLLPLQARDNEDQQVSDKTGVYALTDIHYNNDKLQLGNSLGIGLYKNFRLVKTLYYQPELAYHIINGTGSERQTEINIVPLQMQFGLHLGLARPFIGAGLRCNFAIDARDEQGQDLDLGSLDKRWSYNWYWGCGIDFINTLQVFFRQDFQSNANQQIGISFIL